LGENAQARLRKWAEQAVRTPAGAQLIVDRQVALDVLEVFKFHGELGGET
jgi:hypothetical protein